MRTNFELQKLSEWWFDVSKITLGSMVIKLFEPGIRLENGSVIVLLAGLTVSVFCANIGMQFARKVGL